MLNRLSDDLAPTIADHAWLMTAVSDNTASNVLIDMVGSPAIRDVASGLGLTQTVLHRHVMRKKRPDEPSNSVSAADLTTMLAAIATGRAASPERCAWMRSPLGDQQYRDGIVHDCGLLQGPGGTIALAILTDGCPEPYPAHELMGRIGELAARIVA